VAAAPGFFPNGSGHRLHDKKAITLQNRIDPGVFEQERGAGAYNTGSSEGAFASSE
jgi:hypothetical protein